MNEKLAIFKMKLEETGSIPYGAYGRVFKKRESERLARRISKKKLGRISDFENVCVPK